MKWCPLVALMVAGMVQDGWPAASSDSLYRALAGEYQGLTFADDPAAAHTNSCYFRFKLQNNGAMKGRFFAGGRGFKLNAYVDALGAAEFVMLRGDLWDGDLKLLGAVRFQFDAGAAPGVVYVEASEFSTPDQAWAFGMQGYRTPFDRVQNPVPQAGAYTAILSLSEGVPDIAGYGSLFLSIDPGGLVNAQGGLPDSTGFSHQASLGAEGQWPCYVKFQSGKRSSSSIMGWLQVSPDAAETPSGSLTWTRPGGGASSPSTAHVLSVLGAPFVVSPGQPILQFTRGALVLSGPGLSAPLTNAFLLGEKNKVTPVGPAPVRLTFNSRTGAFSGSTQDPTSGQRLPFKGAVLQPLNEGYGYYLLPDRRTGAVWLGPFPER